MANWPRISLTSPTGGVGFAAGTMKAAVNLYGLTELFISDYSGIIWHAAQYRKPFKGPGPFGRAGYTTVWGPWTSLGTPGPNPNWNGGPVPTTFTVATNADGRLEVIAIGVDGNPYHLYQLPVAAGTVSLSQLLSWSAWSAMTAAPAPLGPGFFVENWWPVAATLGGRIVVCYLGTGDNGAQNLYYDYQVPNASQVGGMGWASVKKGLFTIPLPGPANQFFFSISLVPTGGALSLLALSTLWNIGANGYYVASLATAGGAWSAWQPVPATLPASAYPRIFPNAAIPSGVSASIGYIPGGGAALFFSDNSGALTVLRQVLTQGGPGRPINELQWNGVYDPQLPAGSMIGWPFAVGIAEDRLAEANDPANLHQAAFFGSADGLKLLMLNFQTPAAVPAPPAAPAEVGAWPLAYNGSPAAPVTIDDGSGGAFTSLDQVVALTSPSGGPIQVFGVTDSTMNSYAWTEP